LEAKLTHHRIECPVVKWQRLAVSVDHRIRWLTQSDPRTLEHLQRDVGANDKAGAADNLDGHRRSLASARRNIEHTMTLLYLSGRK